MSREPRNEVEAAAVIVASSERPVWFAACATGPCKGGKKPCPSPVACRLAEPNPPQPPWWVRMLIGFLTSKS